MLDLGYQEIEGIRAHGQRWWFAHADEGDFRELWMSDDLKMDLVYIDQSQTKGKGMRAELTHVRMKEPDRALFKIGKTHPGHVLGEIRAQPDPCAGSSP